MGAFRVPDHKDNYNAKFLILKARIQLPSATPVS